VGDAALHGLAEGAPLLSHVNVEWCMNLTDEVGGGALPLAVQSSAVELPCCVLCGAV